MNYSSIKLLRTRTELGIWDYSPCLLTSKSENKKVICNPLINLIESGYKVAKVQNMKFSTASNFRMPIFLIPQKPPNATTFAMDIESAHKVWGIHQ